MDMEKFIEGILLNQYPCTPPLSHPKDYQGTNTWWHTFQVLLCYLIITGSPGFLLLDLDFQLWDDLSVPQSTLMWANQQLKIKAENMCITLTHVYIHTHMQTHTCSDIHPGTLILIFLLWQNNLYTQKACKNISITYSVLLLAHE